MPQYLIVGYLPDDYDPSAETEATIEGIHALNKEMIAAGVRKLACGLSPKTTTLRAQPNGDVLITDGPYLEAKEHLAGFYVVDCETPQRAAELAAMMPEAAHGGVEVRAVMEEAGLEM